VIASDAQEQNPTADKTEAQSEKLLLRLRKSRWMRELREKKVSILKLETI
jgi:hypothetical protein